MKKTNPNTESTREEKKSLPRKGNCLNHCYISQFVMIRFCLFWSYMQWNYQAFCNQDSYMKKTNRNTATTESKYQQLPNPGIRICICMIEEHYVTWGIEISAGGKRIEQIWLDHRCCGHGVLLLDLEKSTRIWSRKDIHIENEYSTPIYCKLQMSAIIWQNKNLLVTHFSSSRLVAASRIQRTAISATYKTMQRNQQNTLPNNIWQHVRKDTRFRK